MSNHVHVVLRIDPTAVATWTVEEIAVRWVRLLPPMQDGEVDEGGCRTKAETLPGNADRLAVCRQRLLSLARFMRSVNEPIARRANREDVCTGLFRVLTCMSDVDACPDCSLCLPTQHDL